MHEQAEANLRLLDDVCFVPLRRQEHEVPAMLGEILRQAKPGLDDEPPPEGDGSSMTAKESLAPRIVITLSRKFQ